jgi:hypothetical protein
LANLSRNAFRYIKKKKDDLEIKTRLLQITEEHPRWGFSKMAASLRKQGNYWNHKRMYRIYCETRLNLRVKTQKAAAKPPSSAIDPTRNHQFLLIIGLHERLSGEWAIL